jgi:filamentous hemagglutinin family protein
MASPPAVDDPDAPKQADIKPRFALRTHVMNRFHPARGTRRVIAVAAALLSGSAFSADVALGTLPTGAQVTAGQATVSQQGQVLTVNQGSQRAAINWQTFSVGANATVQFAQPNAHAVVLNRVTGSEGSVINGALRANGQVFILNPNGVLFGRQAQVDTAGLLATTLNLSDADFLAGRRQLSGAGGAVVNQGQLNAADGGYIALVGQQVRNDGQITARLGTVVLASGNKVTLNFSGDSLVGVSVDEAAFNALVANGGLVQADGGLVILSARAASGLLDTVVNNTSEIRAHTVSNQRGRIYLLGEDGAVEVSGHLDASAPEGGDGGFIETSGPVVRIADGTRVSTLAAQGHSGSWLIDPVDFTVSAGSASQTASGMGVATLLASLKTTDVTIDLAPTGNGYDNRLLFNASLVTDGALGADRTLTLRSAGQIIFGAGAGIDATRGGNTDKLNTVLWTKSGGSQDSSITLSDTSFIKTNGGHLWMGGGNSSTTWNGLTVGNDKAQGMSGAGIVLGASTLDSGVGDISLNASTNVYDPNGQEPAISSSAGGLLRAGGNLTVKVFGPLGNLVQMAGRLSVVGDTNVRVSAEASTAVTLSNSGNRFTGALTIRSNNDASAGLVDNIQNAGVVLPEPPVGAGEAPTPQTTTASSSFTSTVGQAVRTEVPVASLPSLVGLPTPRGLAEFNPTPPNVVSVPAAIAQGFAPGAALRIMGAPGGNEPSQAVTLSEATGMVQQGSFNSPQLRVPVSRNSLADIVDGGVRLPSGVDQLLFVVPEGQGQSGHASQSGKTATDTRGDQGGGTSSGKDTPSRP